MVTNIDTNDNEPVINDLTPVETTDETTTPEVPVETNNENTEIVADALATAPEPVPEPMPNPGQDDVVAFSSPYGPQRKIGKDNRPIPKKPRHVV